MPLIDCKVELLLNWYERYLLTVANIASFKITDAKIYVPIVTLSSEDNIKLSKLLSGVFKRPIYWNEYKVIANKIVQIAVTIQENTSENYLIQVDKDLKDCLFLHIIIIFLLILIKNIFFQELK